MFKFSKHNEGAGAMRLQLEAPPLSRQWTEEPEVDPFTGAGTADISKSWIVVGLLGLAVGAFCLRFLPNTDHSAYMDEVSQILGGRYLIEQGSVYAYILEWSYGSYLWPLIAGSMDILGGLTMVRAFTALCGVIMTLATAISAYRLSNRAWPNRQRWFVAFGAGLIMAILPTGIGLGNFGTYDGLAGAGLMSGVALLFPVEGNGKRRRFVTAAACLFIAFLSKYVIAIFFPAICLYLIFSAGSVKNAFRRIAWFVGPLTLACAAYFAVFHADLLALLSFSHGYNDLKTADPFFVYVWERPEIWLLAAVASFGWAYATRQHKVVAAGGSGIILAFQFLARADYDFWKHSIYLVFFLSPLAAMALVALALRLYRKITTNPANSPARKRFKLGALGVTASVILGLVLSFSLSQADLLVNFYPNLNRALPAIKQNVSGAETILTDDLALRYYLYPQISTDQVTDPFFFSYKGKTGLDAYKAGVMDRYFDVVILDGGVGPVAQQVNAGLQPLMKQYYSPVATVNVSKGDKVQIYKPQQCVVTDPAPGSQVFDFTKGNQGWGGRSVQGNFQAGSQVAVSQEHTCGGQASLKFSPTALAPQVAVTLKQPVKTVKAQVYIETTPGYTDNSVIGMAVFDQNWQWKDDGFKQSIPTGHWSEITWQIPNPGNYRELDLVFPKEVTTAYISHVELDP